MRRMLEHLVNVVHKEESELLFGKGSKIKISSVSYSTNQKTFVINATAFVSNINESLDVYPEGLNFILKEGWKFIKHDKEPIIICNLSIL